MTGKEMGSRFFTIKSHGPNAVMSHSDPALLALLTRIAESLERQASALSAKVDLSVANAFVWHSQPARLQPVLEVNAIELVLLHGIDRARDILMENTQRFADGLPANNALLWGARGMGKSSLVKAAHASINAKQQGTGQSRSKALPLKLIEIHREDIESLPALMGLVRPDPHQFLIFCDDLSFDHDDTSYKSLKAVLDGGIEGRPRNVIFYATSNRRHLLPRDMMENERSTSINPGEAVEEKVSLSDRFGLWLGFHKCSQDEYLAMVEGYAKHFGLKTPLKKLHAEALEWSTTRGSRTGRVAWQFIQDMAGRMGRRIQN
jgi:uncharacterized protein